MDARHSQSPWRTALALAAITMVLLTGVRTSGQGAASSYVVGAADILQVTVFNQPDLSGKFTVGADGAVTFPLVGGIKVAGSTLREIEARLAEKLRAGILRNPLVSVSVDTYRSQQVFVIGEVRQPGSLYLTGQESLMQLLARAGSTTAEAGTEVLIMRPKQRPTGGGPVRPDQVAGNEVVHVDLDHLASGALADNVSIRDGDTIMVPKAEPVYILGQVRSPGLFRLAKNLTVLQLISLAGGQTERAALNRIRIIRVVDGKKQELKKVALNTPIRANDTVIIPEKFF